MKVDENYICFDNTMPIEEVQKHLETFCSDFKRKGYAFHINYDKAKIRLQLGDTGYYARLKVPVSFILIVVVVFLAIIVLLSILAGDIVTIGTLPALLLGLLTGELYLSSKKKTLLRFCEEARNSVKGDSMSEQEGTSVSE